MGIPTGGLQMDGQQLADWLFCIHSVKLAGYQHKCFEKRIFGHIFNRSN